MIAAVLAASIVWRPVPLLLWNASASSPKGLYAVRPPGRPRRGETVVAWAPPRARTLADERAYLPVTIPLVKPVAAIAGDRVCAHGPWITIDGRAVARRLARDAHGRPLPWWSGCRTLRTGELFLLSAGVADAFDGRYFGVTGPSELVGRARLLWAPAAPGPGDG